MPVEPGQGRKPPSVTAESNPGKEMATAQPSNRKFEHIGIVAVVGAFASVGLVCFVLAMPHPVSDPGHADAVSAANLAFGRTARGVFARGRHLARAPRRSCSASGYKTLAIATG